MKLFAITLALAVFTGSWDSVLSDEPVSKLDQLVGNIEEYFRDISRGLDELGTLVTESNLAHEIKDYIGECYSNISQRLQKVDADLPSEVGQTIQLILDIPTAVAINVLFGHSEVTSRVKPVVEEVYETLEPVMSPYAKPVVDQVKKYADPLRTEIEEFIQKQKGKVKLHMEELEIKAGPYVKNTENRWRELWVAMQPWVDREQERFNEKVVSATNSLKPYLGPVLEKLEECEQEFKNWIGALISPIFS